MRSGLMVAALALFLGQMAASPVRGQAPVFTWKPTPLVFYEKDIIIEISVTGIDSLYNLPLSSVTASIRLDNGTWQMLDAAWGNRWDRNLVLRSGSLHLENKKTAAEVRLQIRKNDWTDRKTLELANPVIEFRWMQDPLVFNERTIALDIIADTVSKYWFDNLTEAVILLDGIPKSLTAKWDPETHAILLKADPVNLLKDTILAHVRLVFFNLNSFTSPERKLVFRPLPVVITWVQEPLIFNERLVTLEIKATPISQYWYDNLIRKVIMIDGMEHELVEKSYDENSHTLSLLAENVALVKDTTPVDVRLEFNKLGSVSSLRKLIYNKPPLLYKWTPEQLIFADSKNNLEVEIQGLSQDWLVNSASAFIRVDKGFWKALDRKVGADKLVFSGEISLENPTSGLELDFKIGSQEFGRKYEEIGYRKPDLQLFKYITSDTLPFTKEPILLADTNLKIIAMIMATPLGVHIAGDEVTAIEWRVNNASQWTQEEVDHEWQKQYITVDVSNAINFGLNQLEIRALGNESGEYSEIKTVDFFVFGIDKKSIPNGLTIFDPLYKIPGRPAGGWYTGTGIVGKTPYFNPETAREGTHEITYHYEINGATLVDMIKLKVTGRPRPGFEITEQCAECPQSSLNRACPGSRHTYRVVSDDISDIKWTVTGGDFEEVAGDPGAISVRWYPAEFWRNYSLANRIGYVKATRLSKVSESDSRTVIVDIGDINSTAKPSLFFGSSNHRLVICNSDSVKQYKWYRIPGNTVITGDTLSSPLQVPLETQDPIKPYYYLPDTPADGEIIIVELSNYSNCSTKSYIINKIGSLVKLGQDLNKNGTLVNGFKVYPNPATDFIYINLENPAEMVTAEIVNLLGEVVARKEFIEPGELTLKFNLGGLASGLYYVRVSGNGGDMRPVKLMLTR
jgi:hypothetical protein